ncbi:hypothetical protein AJ78_07917 [Emergomyces pasteurianus Ep9510]|uniref:Uncharacterized protein n=1 Tax=Emergomyces pasteurianus Ep9510 TaxID=1447872 RepID=A0A1J9P560_9EURO|nr:hypothetical protein AJ78_07917 [Emergomyces pasteurianus Ep9510]
MVVTLPFYKEVNQVKGPLLIGDEVSRETNQSLQFEIRTVVICIQECNRFLEQTRKQPGLRFQKMKKMWILEQLRNVFDGM